MEIPGYTHFADCPATKACVQKNILQKDDTKELYFIPTTGKVLRPHTCRIKAGVLPPTLWVAKYFNMVTKATRIVGPARTKDGVKSPPSDKNYKYDDWKLVDIYRCDANWIRERKNAK